MSAAQSTDLPRVFVPPAPLSRAVMALAGLKFLVHMATAGNYPFHRDELYYLVCGRHPAWGYPDHPPLTPWLSAVSEHLFGLSPWGLRLWPALAGAAIVLLAGWLASRFGGGRLAQLLAALAVALSPLYMSSGLLMQTVALDQLFWVAGGAVLVWGAGLLLGRLLPRDRRHVP
jgi:predicted membrane-bound mannosyltransferase